MLIMYKIKSCALLVFIKQNCSDFKNTNCLKVLCCSLVRSILGFSFVVWNPMQNNSVDKLEKLQRRFLRIMAFHIGYKTDVG